MSTGVKQFLEMAKVEKVISHIHQRDGVYPIANGRKPVQIFLILYSLQKRGRSGKQSVYLAVPWVVPNLPELKP